MPKAPRKEAPFPTREALLTFIRESPTPVGKREIARAFQLHGEARVMLKLMLRELEASGALQRDRGRRVAPPAALPEVAVLEVCAIDEDGEVLARPLRWESEAPPPRIFMKPERRGHPALGIGDRVLARLERLSDRQYQARTMRRLDAEGTPRLIGQFHPTGHGGRIESTNRRERTDLLVAPGDTLEAEAGELVLAELLPTTRAGLRQARVVERLGSAQAPRAFSLIAIHSHGLPTAFLPRRWRKPPPPARYRWRGAATCAGCRW